MTPLVFVFALLPGQTITSSTATLAETATVSAEHPTRPSTIDRLSEMLLYVGVPLLLPDPPPPRPQLSETTVEPLPPPVGPPLPGPKDRTSRWFDADSPWIGRLHAFDDLLTMISIVVLMVLAGLLGWFARRQRDGRSLAARAATTTNKVLRILAAILSILFAIAWLPSDALPFALLAVALALAWSLRDVLPDLIAGAVLSFERRVRPGVWLSGAGFAGVVERVGLRATWLRDSTHRRLAVPNRVLISAPLTSDDGRWPTREITLRLETQAPAELVRRAIADAVLASPWTPVNEEPGVRRDGSNPAMWHVRARVLDLSFAEKFDGELLERAEAILAHALARSVGEHSGTHDRT